MKTAMQELLELCKHYQSTFQNPIGEIVKKIESELLEKEKEQIKAAFVVHYTGTAEEYYNETFNTNESE